MGRLGPTGSTERGETFGYEDIPKREANSGSESIFAAVGFLDAYDGGIPNGERSGNGEGTGNGCFYVFWKHLAIRFCMGEWGVGDFGRDER